MGASPSALVSPKGWAPTSPQRQNCHCQEKAPAAPITPGPHPASSCAENDPPGAKAQGEGKPGGDGMQQAGPGLAQDWRGLATAELDESLGMAILGRNTLGRPGHRAREVFGSRRKADGGERVGKRWIFKTQPANQSHCCGCLKRDQQK